MPITPKKSIRELVADILDDMDREDGGADGPAMPLKPTPDLIEEVWNRLPGTARQLTSNPTGQRLVAGYVDEITGGQVAAYVIANKMAN